MRPPRPGITCFGKHFSCGGARRGSADLPCGFGFLRGPAQLGNNCEKTPGVTHNPAPIR